MLAPVRIVVTVVIGYVLGSIPIANLVARREGGGDLREVGDRNPGYWNARATLGRRAALPVFVGDVAKGAAAALVGCLAAGDGEWWMAYLGTGAAMVGHAFPVFAGFHGGRSVLAFVGGALVAAPLPALGAIGIALLAGLLVRRFEIGARAGVAAYPCVQLALDGPYRTAATGALMTFIGVRFAAAAWRSRAHATAAGG
jgi:glycerol-3-phosphate acyltransferase PlsY